LSLRLTSEESVLQKSEAKTATHIALLAPVPSGHLTSALETLKSEDWVAFGSGNAKLFKKLESLRKGLDVDVYIYASSPSGDSPPEASWRARFIGIAHDSSAQSLTKFRPASTANDTSSAIYWQVVELKRVPPPDRLKIADFTGFEKGKAYSSTFVPRGPLLIEHPL
jgi:hypothetical protein